MQILKAIILVVVRMKKTGAEKYSKFTVCAVMIDMHDFITIFLLISLASKSVGDCIIMC